MKTNSCNTCAYYLQHYTLNQKDIFKVDCGHCTYGRPKRKRPDAKICDHFSPRAEGEEPFVRKEYLSKALLDYVLKLDLLPEICELADKTDR